MEINIREIKKLIELIEGSSVGEIEISQGDESIRIARPKIHTEVMAAPQHSYHHHTTQMVGPSQAAAMSEAPALASEKAEVASITGYQVKSPMVGTLYRAPSPDAPNFVEVGQRVEVGQTLCIIEAMKMMNQIEAEQAGVVKAILVENSSPVEFDQPLIVIDTNA